MYACRAKMDQPHSMNVKALDDETLLNLGLHVLQEILFRRIHQNTGGIVPAKKKGRAPTAKKVVVQDACVLVTDGKVEITEEELVGNIFDMELTEESYVSPPPSAVPVPDAPKKASKQKKQPAVDAMFAGRAGGSD